MTLARRLVEEAGVAAIGFHPRHASQQHKGKPDYELAAELVEALDVPGDPVRRHERRGRDPRAYEETGVDGGDARARLARQAVAVRAAARPARRASPTRAEIVDELLWVIDRGEEHLGVERAGRYLRKFYPWYADALGLTKRERQPLVTAPRPTAERPTPCGNPSARLIDPSRRRQPDWPFAGVRLLHSPVFRPFNEVFVCPRKSSSPRRGSRT